MNLETANMNAAMMLGILTTLAVWWFFWMVFPDDLSRGREMFLFWLSLLTGLALGGAVGIFAHRQFLS